MKKLLLITVLLATGCSLRFDFNECATDSDCEKFETGTTLLACESDQCVVSREAKECTTDADCTDEAPRTECRDDACREPMSTNNDMPDATPDMTGDMPVDMDNRIPCTSNSECNPNAQTTDDYDSLCVEEFCVTAVTDECAELGGQLDASRTVLMGVILPMSDFNIGPPLRNSIDLAIEEFNNAGGLPGGRRLTYIVCDDLGNAATAVVSARHISETLKAPGIVGPLFSESLIDVAQEVAIANGTILVSPAASADNVTNLVDNDLVWRVISSDRWQAKALADRVAELGGTRVGVFYKDDTYGQGLEASLRQELTARLGLASTNVRARPYATGLTDNDLIADWEVDLSAIRAGGFTPDLYVFIGTTEAVTLTGEYFAPVNGNPPVPVVLSHGGAPGLPVLITNAPTLQPLVTSVGQNIFNGDNFVQYVGRYAGKFQGEGPLTISTLTYDAALTIAFAMVPIDQADPITGVAIASHIPKLADKANGTVIQAQGSFIGEAINALAGGGTIDLAGVSGELDFDGQGDVRSDFLRLIAVDNAGTWELTANAVYLYGTPPGNLGFWRARCGADFPAEDCSTQLPAGQSCIASVGLCLEVGCVNDINPCDDGVCVPQGPGFCSP